MKQRMWPAVMKFTCVLPPRSAADNTTRDAAFTATTFYAKDDLSSIISADIGGDCAARDCTRKRLEVMENARVSTSICMLRCSRARGTWI